MSNESIVGWVGYSAEATRRLAADLEPDTDGVVDEMGLLAIHSGYADRFFPGTSVLQRRPRYAFFTCWNYLKLDDSPEGNTRTERKESAERWVKQQLLAAGLKTGVIGIQVERPAQPVDYIYWSCLKKWGLYRGPDRARLLTKPSLFNISRVAERRQSEDSVVHDAPAQFMVPEPPRFWLRPRPRTPLTFELTLKEAEFLKIRLETLGPCLLSQSASHAQLRSVTRNTPWDDPSIILAAKALGETSVLERSALASSLARFVRAIYAALVERRCNEIDERPNTSSDSEYYRRTLTKLIKDEPEQLKSAMALQIEDLCADIPDLGRDSRLSVSLLKTLGHVQSRLTRIQRPADIDAFLLDNTTLEIFSTHEVMRKGSRARLPDNQAARDRRIGFNDHTINVYPLDYRWSVARAIIQDLHAGLNRTSP